jgi:hypothetical protein
MVPAERLVTAASRTGGARIPEAEVVKVAAEHLNGLGYRTFPDPDGTDYFDLVARRGDEVGLVEAKVGNARRVLVQALRRRVWGNWVAVIVASRRSAERLADRTAESRSSPVGVWAAEDRRVTVVRPARPWEFPARADPYAELRVRFRRLLDDLEAGIRPSGVAWDDVPREIRRASGGRGFAEWRLDEGPFGP